MKRMLLLKQLQQKEINNNILMDSNFQLEHLAEINQLNREFSNQEFISVVQQLLRDLQLNTSLDLAQLYLQIEKKSGKVIGKDILKLLHVLKEQTNLDKQLDIQLRFYFTTISQLQSKGKNILTIGQFFVSFVLNNPKKGIVTSEIQQKISAYKVISLQKLLSVIQCIEITRKESKILKSNKNSQKELHKYEEQSTLQQTIQWSYLSSLKVILFQHVFDSKQLQRAMNLMNRIKEELDDKNQYDDKLNQIQRKHEEKYSQLAEQLFKFQQALQQKDYIINKLQQQNMKYEQQIQIFEEKCQQDFIDTITKMSQQNQKLLRQKNEAMIYIKQVQKQIQSYRHIYSEKMLQLEESQEQKQKQNYPIPSLEIIEEQMQIDSPDIVLKNQLKQAYNKIGKLRKENQELKNQISELRAQLQSKAYVSGRQTDRTFKNLVLDQNPFCQQARDTFLDIIRKGSYAEILTDEELENLSYNNHSSKKLVRSITKQHLIDSMDMNQEETLQERIFKIDSFDFIGVQNQLFLKDLASFMKSTSISLNKFKPIFSASIEMVSHNGNKQKLALIHSSDKILLCNFPSFNIKYITPLSGVEQIVIPEQPRNYIVLKLKQKNKKISQFVLSMNRRKQYLKYLLKVQILELGQSQVKITFQKEEKIELNMNNQMISLTKFRDVNNLIWRSIYDGEKVFEGKIKLIRFLSKQINCMIVITSIGILGFCKKKEQWQETTRKQVIILPYNKNMQIIDLSKEKQLKIVYPSIQKSYLLEFLSYAETKVAKALMELEREKIMNDFKQESQKYLSICAGFNKLGSIQQQYSDISE